MVERSIGVFGIRDMTTQVCFGCTTTTWNGLDAQSTVSTTMQTCGRCGFAIPNSERFCKKTDGQTTGTFGQSFHVLCLIAFSMRDGQLPNPFWNTACKDPFGLLFPVCWWFVQRCMCAFGAGANPFVHFRLDANPRVRISTSPTGKKSFVLILILLCIVHLNRLVCGSCLRRRLHTTARLRRSRCRSRDRSRGRCLYNRNRDLLLLRSLLLKHLRLNSSAH